MTSIDRNGNIKNCPTMDKSYGNIKNVPLFSAVVKKTFTKYWHINKDKISDCRVCEFRYICSDCRALISNPEDIYSKPSKCKYHPYTSTWDNQ
ncbi:MAG: hypothetical protein Fur0023_12220 [Bacteroidia bacterium]